MIDDKYHPRQFEEMVEDRTPTTILNEVAPDSHSAAEGPILARCAL
jgi:hypothetical protein